MNRESEARARVIIVNYNGGDYVRDAIDSALRQTAKTEVVVVDNASSDGSADLLAETPGIELIRSSSNEGFGAAVNRGARHAGTPFLAFLNPDAVADANWIEALTSWMDQNSVDIACSVIRANDSYYFTRGVWVWWLGGATDLKTPSIKPTDWVNGCALVIRREVFERLGGFDESFFLYGEDVDLSLRARALGSRVGIFQTALASHDRHGRSSDLFALQKFVIAFESRGRLTRKHGTWFMLPIAWLVQGLYHPLRFGGVSRSAFMLSAAYFRGFFGRNTSGGNKVI